MSLEQKEIHSFQDERKIVRMNEVVIFVGIRWGWRGKPFLPNGSNFSVNQEERVPEAEEVLANQKRRNLCIYV